MARARGSPLARELCLVYLLLTVYATLHPFTGWRDRGLSPFAWAEIWPRVVLPFDLALNVAAYLPLGLFVFWATHARLTKPGAVLFASLAGAALSGVLEALQTYLPSRTPSLADFATNALGAVLGAIVGAVLVVAFGRGALSRVGDWFAESAEGARSAVLAGLWLFALLFPQSILFGHGSLIAWLGPVSGYPFTPAEFSRVESAVTAASLYAAGSLALGALRPRSPRLALLALFIAVACAARTLSQAILFPPEHLWSWLTPGAQRGLAIGAVLLALTVALPRPMRLVLIAITVTFATLTVNFAPPNPYYLATVQDLNPGRFLNFNGLTQLVSSAWPFLVALYLPFALAGDARNARAES